MGCNSLSGIRLRRPKGKRGLRSGQAENKPALMVNS
jgi:hypothetical protein